MWETIDGDLFAERTGWVRGDDGLLVRDENANGLIDDVCELFGGPGASGFAELATQDGNGDGRIDANDAVYASLRVWRDLNGNGVSEASELQTLSAAGIASINLASTPSNSSNAGNTIAATGTFTRTDGSTRTVADVQVKVDNFDTLYQGDTSVSAIAAALPQVKGRGTLADLRVAMTLDPTLIATERRSPGRRRGRNRRLAALRRRTPRLVGARVKHRTSSDSAENSAQNCIFSRVTRRSCLRFGCAALYARLR